MAGDYWSRIKKPWPFFVGLRRISRDYYVDVVRKYGIRSVIDLGCGFGETFRVLRKAGISIHYVGIDSAPNFIESASKRYKMAQFQVGKIEDIPYPDNSFDLATARCVLEHLPDPEPAIREMARVGKMVLIVWFRPPGKKDRTKYDQRGFWENDYLRERILNLCDSAGLELIDEFSESRHRVWVLA